MWQVKFLNEAKKDLAKLDNSLKVAGIKGDCKSKNKSSACSAWLW